MYINNNARIKCFQCYKYELLTNLTQLVYKYIILFLLLRFLVANFVIKQ